MPKQQTFETGYGTQVQVVDFPSSGGKRLYFGEEKLTGHGYHNVSDLVAEVRITDHGFWLHAADGSVVTSVANPKTPKRLAIELCRGIDAKVVDERSDG